MNITAIEPNATVRWASEANASRPAQRRNLQHSLAEIAALLQADPSNAGEIRAASGACLTVESVQDACAQLAAAGIGHGERVIVRARHSVASVAWFVAIWSAGAVLIPVGSQTSDDALEAIASDSGARAICDPDTSTVTLREAVSSSRFSYLRTRRVTGVDLALIIYTSGSTGKPKGILLTHANVMAALRAITHYQRLDATDRILCVPPLHFDYGLYQVLFAFHTGCSVVLADEPAQPVSILKQIKAHRPTVLPIVPAIGIGIAATMTAFSQKVESVRLITNTGGHLPAPTIAALQAGFPACEVMPMYGLTESKRALFVPAGEVDRHPLSVGVPMPGLDAKVFVETALEDGSQHYREAQPDEVGKLFVRGASVMQGYSCENNGAGAKLIGGQYRDDNWLDTGDLFCVDAEGYFYFRGRDKELIKQAGFCLYPREIEALAETCEGVLGAAVVGCADRGGDEIACLFVKLSGEADAGSRDAFRAMFRSRMDPNQTPRRMEFVDDWPINANGKIDRRALTQRASAS